MHIKTTDTEFGPQLDLTYNLENYNINTFGELILCRIDRSIFYLI